MSFLILTTIFITTHVRKGNHWWLITRRLKVEVILIKQSFSSMQKNLVTCCTVEQYFNILYCTNFAFNTFIYIRNLQLKSNTPTPVEPQAPPLPPQAHQVYKNGAASRQNGDSNGGGGAAVNEPSLSIKKLCRLPSLAGDCSQAFPRFYYSPHSRHCLEFTYGGCSGNENNFENRTECEDTCLGVKRK